MVSMRDEREVRSNGLGLDVDNENVIESIENQGLFLRGCRAVKAVSMCAWDVKVLLRRFSARGTALEK